MVMVSGQAGVWGYLVGLLLHGVVEQRQAATDELLADDHAVPQDAGGGRDPGVPQGLAHQHAHVLLGQGAGQHGLGRGQPDGTVKERDRQGDRRDSQGERDRTDRQEVVCVCVCVCV